MKTTYSTIKTLKNIALGFILIGNGLISVHAQQKAFIQNYNLKQHDSIQTQSKNYTKYAKTGSSNFVAKTVIVEFVGEPLCVLYNSNTSKTKAAIINDLSQKNEIYNTFESDIKTLYTKTLVKSGSTTTNKYGMSPVLGRKYSKAFFGQSVKLDSLMIDDIKKLPYVKRVYENRVFKINTDDSNSQINADSIWNEYNCEGDSIKIGIIDTGIDYNHPDLGGGFGKGHKVVGGYDFVDNDTDPMDENSHGTHVAGIVAANGVKKGVAPKALLYAVRVLNKNGEGSEEEVIAGIEYTIDPNNDGDFSDKLDVVNMSLGGTPSEYDPMVKAVENAVKLGVTFCIAAGNSGPANWTIGSPGTAPSVITVGAVNKNDTLALFSSCGPSLFTNILKPDVVAPGVIINSTVLNNEYEAYSGTSMATPHVTGVCALLKKLHPNWTPADIKSALMSTAKDIGIERNRQGVGRVDAFRAALVTSVVSNSTLDFGLDTADANSSWSGNLTFTVKNVSNTNQTYTIGKDTSMAGVKVTADNYSFSLLPGETKEVNVTLLVDNNLLKPVFNRDRFAYCYWNFFNIKDNSSNIPVYWSFIRSFKLKINISKGNLHNVTIIQKEGEGTIYSVLDGIPSTIILPLGQYTIIACFYDSVRMKDLTYNLVPNKLVIKQVDLANNYYISLSEDEACNKIVLSTTDENGNTTTPDCEKWRCFSAFINDTILYQLKLQSGPDVFWGEILGLFSAWGSGLNQINISYSFFGDGYMNEKKKMDTLYVSNLPNNVKISVAESRLHKDNINRFCFNEWGPLSGLKSDTTFTSDYSSYKYFRFKNPHCFIQPNWTPKLYFKNNNWLSTQLIYFSKNWSIYDDVYPEFNVYLSENKNINRDLYYFFSLEKWVFDSIQDMSIDRITAPINFENNQFFFGTKKTKDTYTFNAGDEVTYSQGAIFQKTQSINLLDSSNNIIIGTSLRGQMNEFVMAPFLYSWELFDENNKLVDSQPRQYMVFSKQVPGEYHAKMFLKDVYKVGSSFGSVTTNQYFDLRKNDPDAPTITSLLIENSKGKQTCYFDKNDSVFIRFSMADFVTDKHNFANIVYKPVVSDSTRLYVKDHTSDIWEPIKTTVIGEDTTVGLTYFAKIKNTSFNRALLDIKISSIDYAGNKAEQIYSPAILIDSSFVPVAVNDAYYTKINKQLHQKDFFTHNDINPMGIIEDLKFIIVDSVKYGFLKIENISIYSDSLKFSYFPNKNFTGIDSFTYKLTNDTLESNIALVKIYVDSVINSIVIPIAFNQTHVISVYPNPIINKLNTQLNIQKPEQVSIDITDISGKTILNLYNGYVRQGIHSFSWNINLQPSIYLLHVKGKTINESCKLIVNHR
jgi:subtilisin family serine protease